MTHDEALDVLTAWIVAGGRGHPTSVERRRAAEDHVGRCRACWDELCTTHEVLVGTWPEADDRMNELLGCAPAQREMYALVGLTPLQIEKQHPRLARHLTGCQVCRDHLAELVEMDAFVDKRRATEGLRNLLQHLVVTIREGIVRFSELPDHLVAGPLIAAAGVSRGPTKVGPGVSAGERVSLDVGQSGLKMDVAVQPDDSGRLRLSLALSGREVGPIDVSLREIREIGEVLIKEQSPIANRMFVAEGVRAGCYALDIHDTATGERYRIQLDVVATGA